MKNLPKMYHKEINKEVKNNEKMYTSINSNNVLNREYNVEERIREMFNSSDYIYKINVTIVTNQGVMNKKIIGKNRDNLITIDNEYIPISNIIDIYRNN